MLMTSSLLYVYCIVYFITGITVLLAFSVFMLAVAENLPETSEFVPLISKIYSTSPVINCNIYLYN